MRAFLRAWWPYLTFGVWVLGRVAFEVADTIEDERDARRRYREHLAQQTDYLVARTRADVERREVNAAVARIMFLGVVAPAGGVFLLVWAAYGIWSAITGEPVTW